VHALRGHVTEENWHMHETGRCQDGRSSGARTGAPATIGPDDLRNDVAVNLRRDGTSTWNCWRSDAPLPKRSATSWRGKGLVSYIRFVPHCTLLTLCTIRCDDPNRFNMAEMQIIPARHGVATFVPAGQTIKIVNTSGTQVVGM